LLGSPTPDRRLLLTELLTPDRIKVPLEAGDKPGVIRELTQLLAERAGGDPARILAASRNGNRS
jgi:Phosphotransferase system mannitol/fructose-specific IIA domain (Ntr-type)